MSSRYYDDYDDQPRPSRGRRERTFDDQPGYDYPSSPAATGRRVTGTVKWYNAEKGFGFVALSDGDKDPFLHASVLNASGYTDLSEGATVEIEVAPGPKGRVVKTLYSVDPSTASRSAPRASERPISASRAPERPSPAPAAHGATQQVRAVVKWFDTRKGFGFMEPVDGGKDIFVHISAVTRSGLHAISEGELFDCSIEQGQKGPQVFRLDR